jgi:DHA1 family inner membrane transport protein
MLALAVALTLGNTLTLLAPTFELVAASRVLAGLPHGAYFGIGALVAADVMGPGNRAKGVAFVLTGLTVANVVGVPLGTFLGQRFGWRIAFLVVALIFALAAVMIALTVPAHAGDPVGRSARSCVHCASARCGSRSASARSDSAGSSRRTATSPRSSPRSPELPRPWCR